MSEELHDTRQEAALVAPTAGPLRQPGGTPPEEAALVAPTASSGFYRVLRERVTGPTGRRRAALSAPVLLSALLCRRYSTGPKWVARRAHVPLSASLLALVLFVGGCSSGESRSLEGTAAEIYGGVCAPSAGREVTVYSGRTENLIEPVLDAFACETGVDVRVRWASSTDLALLIAEEGDRTAADVFLSRSPGPVGFLESRGLLATLRDDVLALVGPENRSASLTWVGFSGRKRVLVYNTDLVAPEELPNSVFDLTGERYRNRVAIPAVNGSFVDWFTVFRDQAGTDVATEWLHDMVANDARFYPNNRSIVEAAGRGEIDMGLVNHYYQYQEAAAAGDRHRAANHSFANDDIGSLLIITAATVTATSDDTDTANDLIAYMLTEPVQRYFSERTFEYPLAADMPPADILPPLQALEIGSVDFDALGGGFKETIAIIEASGIHNK